MCVSGWAKASYVSFFALLWLYLYSSYRSDCSILKWGLNTLSRIVWNKLNFPLGFASLKSFTMFQEPLSPISFRICCPLRAFRTGEWPAAPRGLALPPRAKCCQALSSVPALISLGGVRSRTVEIFLQKRWAESLPFADVHLLQRKEAEAEYFNICTGCSLI